MRSYALVAPFLLLGSLALSFGSLSFLNTFPDHDHSPYPDFEVDLQKCSGFEPKPLLDTKVLNRIFNDRADRSAPAILFKNATVWTATVKTPVLFQTDVLLKNGLIAAVGSKIDLQKEGLDYDVITIDASGRFLTPGIVDLHSHLGVDSWPELRGGDDTNEATNPTFPQLRSLDGIDPKDPAIRLINQGGVTTALVLPGSANLFGGEAFPVKLFSPIANREERQITVEDLLVQNAPRHLKMACGENPKRVYGNQGKTPGSRLGNAWLIREKFFQASQLKKAQNNWCDAAKSYKAGHGNAPSQPYPEDLSLESTVAVLRGQVNLQVHCYEIQDFEMIIRISKEFNFKVTTFHHALEAWKVPQVLLKENIGVATFSDHWGFKREAYQASAYAPKILEDAGVDIILKSDHPVLDSRFLVWEAGKAFHYGMSEQGAFAAITRTPAKRMGLINRIGTLEVGKDADIVLWDIEPLRTGARPLVVVVDGSISHNVLEDAKPATEEIPRPQVAPSLGGCEKASSVSSSSFAFVNVGSLYVAGSTGANRTSRLAGPLDIVVENGVISCIGSSCPRGNARIFDLKGGSILPSILSLGNNLGLEEIASESSTSDGTPAADLIALSQVRASEGLSLDGKKIENAFKGGVLASVSIPNGGSKILRGLSVLLRTSARNADLDSAILKDVVALHGNIGQGVKGSGSLSEEIPRLRQLLRSAQKSLLNGDEEFDGLKAVVAGTIPFVIQVNHAEDIVRLLKLKSEFPKLRLVLQGAAEGWIVADAIASSGVPVILNPVRCTPATWESKRCDIYNGIRTLYNAGVKLTIGVSDNADPRNLLFEAGWVRRIVGSTFEESLAMVTSNAAEVFGVADVLPSLRVGDKAAFVATNAIQLPDESNTRIQAVVDGNQIECLPLQY